MTQYIPISLPESPASKVLHNQVHEFVKALVPLGELTVVRDFLTPPDQLILKEENVKITISFKRGVGPFRSCKTRSIPF
jgi:hypothetical protein